MILNNKNIFVLLPILGQPRHAKRIEILEEIGYNISAQAFDRNYHSGRIPNCKLKVISKINHGKYFERSIKMLLSIFKVRKELVKHELIYVFGVDMLILVVLASVFLPKKKVILEIGDINSLQVNKNFFGKIFRKIDRYFTNKVDLLIVTSNDFYNEYYRKWLNIDIKSLTMENKVEKSNVDFLKKQIHKKPINNKIVIGYFGSLWCDWSLEILIKLALKNNNFEIIIAGHHKNEKYFKEKISLIKNIKYFGSYKSPYDLPLLYNQVDIVWASYKYIEDCDWNLKWARTNRFYESCCMQKPLIVRMGSNDSKAVKLYDIGLILESIDDNETIKLLSGLNAKIINKWQENITKIDDKIFSYDNEIGLLNKCLKDITNDI